MQTGHAGVVTEVFRRAHKETDKILSDEDTFLTRLFSLLNDDLGHGYDVLSIATVVVLRDKLEEMFGSEMAGRTAEFVRKYADIMYDSDEGQEDAIEEATENLLNETDHEKIEKAAEHIKSIADGRYPNAEITILSLGSIFFANKWAHHSLPDPHKRIGPRIALTLAEKLS